MFAVGFFEILSKTGTQQDYGARSGPLRKFLGTDFRTTQPPLHQPSFARRSGRPLEEKRLLVAWMEMTSPSNIAWSPTKKALSRGPKPLPQFRVVFGGVHVPDVLMLGPVEVLRVCTI